MEISVKSLTFLTIGVVGGLAKVADARIDKRSVARDAAFRCCAAQARYPGPGGVQEIGVALDCSPTNRMLSWSSG
jgi:hypothetical protein